MPVPKQPGPAQPKKRGPRSGALSISAPLGDFRHTLHGPGQQLRFEASSRDQASVSPPPQLELTPTPRCRPDADARQGMQPRRAPRPDARLELDQDLGL
ncbi:cdc42 effector protein 5 [Fukomys damarensis]|uniref:cdc42 effector protein 5 n=1 Tax=Fukomys damarensis TaxID=885580 RepID=UPI0014552AA3|nr:cdc42 effector protein 5 [Fukomys damarensis]